MKKEHTKIAVENLGLLLSSGAVSTFLQYKYYEYLTNTYFRDEMSQLGKEVLLAPGEISKILLSNGTSFLITNRTDRQIGIYPDAFKQLYPDGCEPRPNSVDQEFDIDLGSSKD